MIYIRGASTCNLLIYLFLLGPPFFFPLPRASPFLALVPSLPPTAGFLFTPSSFSNPILLTRSFFLFFFSLVFVFRASRGRSGSPILFGRIPFFALRIAALMAPFSPNSASSFRANLRRLALRVSPANLSRLGCNTSQFVYPIAVISLAFAVSSKTVFCFFLSLVEAGKPDWYCRLLRSKFVRKQSGYGIEITMQTFGFLLLPG